MFVETDSESWDFFTVIDISESTDVWKDYLSNLTTSFNRNY